MDTLDVARYLDRRLPAEHRARVEAHLAGCNSCRDEVVAVSGLLAHARRRRRLVFTAPLAVAAAILLVLLPRMGNRQNQGLELRRGASADVLTAYGPLGESASARPRFVWGAVPNVQSYRLTVSRANGTTLWSGSSADTGRSLPDSMTLHAGASYWWVADALLDDGTSRSTGVHNFRVAP